MLHVRHALIALLAIFIALLLVIVGERLYQKFGADIATSRIVEVIGGD